MFRGDRPPGSVRLASWLLAACAALSASDALSAVLATRHLDAAGPAYLARTAFGLDVVAELRSRLFYNLVVAIGAALVLAPLSVAVRQPWRTARILAWCAAFTVCAALGCGIAGGPEEVAWGGGDRPPELQRALENLLAGWYSLLHGLMVLGLLAGLTAITVQLLRTSAHEFYRTRNQDGGPGLWTFARGSGS